MVVTRELISRRVRAVPPSGIRRFFDIAATMPSVISLGVGEPDFVTPDPIREAGIAALREGRTAYTSNSGLLELRVALAEHLERLYGLRYDPEKELLITVGVSEALQNTMVALIDPGDQVIIPEPCFVAYGACVAFADGQSVYVPTRLEDAFQVDPDAIEAAITPQTKAILIGYPNNPTGAVLSRERMLAIAEIAERHDLVVISDEIYDRLVYGVEHICFPVCRSAACCLAASPRPTR
jgi:aminotransferase